MIKKTVSFFIVYGLKAGMYYILYNAINRVVFFLEKISLKVFLHFKNSNYKANNHPDLIVNKKLKNTHQNQEAIVLGTGPSALNITDPKYSNKTIICVNEGVEFLVKSGIHPSYAIINDDQYYEDDEKFISIVKLLNLVKSRKLKAFMPLRHKKKILKYLDERVIGEHLFFYQTFPSNLKSIHLIDNLQFLFDQIMPSLPTVTHLGLVLSIFLGFKKTYLLGVDMDYILKLKEPIRHCYDGMEGFDRKFESCLSEYKKQMNWSVEDVLKQTLVQLSYYKIIKHICQKINHTIVNLSSISCLQEFVFETEEDL